MKHNTTQAPAPVAMTMAEWQKTHRDFKGVYNGQRCVANDCQRQQFAARAHHQGGQVMQAHFGAVIYAYSRAQALADGTLNDVSEVAREAGFACPVALTSAAWCDCVAWSQADSQRQGYQDEAGRLWDVLWLASPPASD